MGIFSGIFSSDTANKTVDGIFDGIDKAFYTDEEKADAVQKQADTKLKLLPLFEPFKKTQRVIAIGFAINFILWVWVAIGLLLFSPVTLVAFTALLTSFNVGWIMMAIVGFYFSGGVIDSFKGKG